MSNRITIEPTRFTSVRSGTETHGYRAYDSYAATYSNNLPSIPDDDREFLRLVIASGTDEVLEAMLDWICEKKVGLYIGETFYPYASIADILDARDFHLGENENPAAGSLPQ